MILTEGDIKFDFSRALSCKKFDNNNHGLSHCMKAVDFIIELDDRIYFVEVKDPQHPSARNLEENVKTTKSGDLVKNKLVQKCRDSFLYEYAMDNISKPVFFLVLIGLDSLSTADLNIQTDILKKHIPVDGPPGTSWPERFIKGCMIMNLQTWNKHLTHFPVSRISSVNYKMKQRSSRGL